MSRPATTPERGANDLLVYCGCCCQNRKVQGRMRRLKWVYICKVCKQIVKKKT